jgi:hypothetical protein
MAEIRHAGIDMNQNRDVSIALRWRSAELSKNGHAQVRQVGAWTKVQRLIRNILLFLAGA